VNQFLYSQQTAEGESNSDFFLVFWKNSVVICAGLLDMVTEIYPDWCLVQWQEFVLRNIRNISYIVHKCIRTSVLTCMYIYLHKCVHTYIHGIHLYTYNPQINIYIYSYMHTSMRTSTNLIVLGKLKYCIYYDIIYEYI
jgi:hypothetical protein